MATKLILALDVTDFNESKKIVDELATRVEVFKIGSILFTREGRNVIDYIHNKGRKVFLDLKFFDIPNTVQEVCSAAAALGVEMFTIHLLGGKEMILSAMKGAAMGGKIPPLILGVTILTSTNAEILSEDMKVKLKLPDMVAHLAHMGYQEGVRGFVCSPLEIELLRKTLGSDAVLVTPGVRLAGDSLGDQKRVMTPKKAKEQDRKSTRLNSSH